MYLRCFLLPLIFFFSQARSEKFGIGSCPDVSVKQPFDVSKYTGLWYEIEKYPVIFEYGLRCITARYDDKGDYISVNNTGIKKNGEKDSILGRATIPNHKESAKLIVKFDGMPFQANYWILDTDYDNYSVVWSCFGVASLLNIEYLWILSRTPALEDAVKSNIYNYLDSKKIDRTHLTVTDQSCVH